MVSISLQVPRRCCSLWCWASVLTAIAQVVPVAGATTQEDFFQLIYGGQGLDCTGCCPNGCPERDDTCNLPAGIGSALYECHLSSGNPVLLGPDSFDAITRQIDKKRPVVAQIDFDDETLGTHYLLIHGYAVPDTLLIGDPADGKSISVQFSTYSYTDPEPDYSDRHGHWTSMYFIDAA